jgi:hypothetical protein
MFRRAALCLAFVGAVVLGCSSTSGSSGAPAGTGASKSEPIGAAGGKVAIEGVTLTIPPGALAKDQTITVTSTTGSAPSGAAAFSAVYSFTPAGLEFATPVTVEIAFNGDAAKAALFWSSDGAAWEKLATTAAGTTAKASINHFSTGFVGDGTVTFPGLAGGGADGGSTNKCGTFYTAGVFACYQSKCTTQFKQCFGPDSQNGVVAGACKAYGTCICTCTSDADCQRCTLDPTCDSCNKESGLFECAAASCATAGGG